MLRKIEDGTFEGCKGLKGICFGERLEHIGKQAFSGSGLYSVAFPASLRVIAQGAFSACKNLKTAVLNDGLEVLGTDEYSQGNEMLKGVFQKSAVEDVKLPKTLKRIEYKAFANCESLRRIYLPDGLDYIGKGCFSESGLQEIAFPASIKTVSVGAFLGCKQLR